ncbi:MAG: AsmA-like C-terminal region-containing protein, partial [Pirellulaceae bacterium]|nr:AsmA-like C-terminal region-containing protein [Pirellulaceae bacterium]
LGYGNATGQAVIHDLFRQPQWRLQGQLTGLELTGRLLPWLKPELQRLWHQYQPGGVVDADFDIQMVDGKLTKSIKATIKEGSFSWYRFPFPMSQCNGFVEWIGDDLAVSLTAIEAQQAIAIRGEVKNPGPFWTGWLEGSCDGLLPINEKMFQAFDNKPELARTLRKFHATGHINGRGRIERWDGNADLQRDFNIQLMQATLRHENFDYPIYNVGGTIRVVNDLTEFRSFAGQNNIGQIQCEGAWTSRDGLQLSFLASNVLLNDELRLALPENLQKTWNGLRPTGTIDLIDLDMRYPGGHQAPIFSAKIDVTGQRDGVSSVSVNPIWFPYEMRQVTGSFGFKDQNVNINNFAAKHGDTHIRTNGNGRYDATSWNLRFSEMFVRDIELDDELRRALPASIAQAADQVGFSGNIGMRGALVLNGSFQPTPQASAYVSARDPQMPSANLQWQLEFGITRAAVNVGLPLTDISGLMKLNGRYAAGKTECLGQLQVDSMMYHDIQVTSANIPFSIDNQKIGIGTKLRRNGEPVNDRPATGLLFGGRVQCDAEVSLQDLNSFIIDAQLVGGDVETFASEISLAQHDFSGDASAVISLKGNASGTHSLQGNGSITLQDAKIYEVPVIVALFNVLRIKEPDRTAFDKAKMTFAVRGENFDIKPIELNGDAISLIGEGTIDLDSNVDLNFYSLIGRNGIKIPIITELYKAGSKQVWWIKVAGTLQDPVTEHEVLPGLNDSLRMLFPELAEDDQ